MSDVFDYYRRRARAEKAKAQARDTKSVADHLKESVDEAKSVADGALADSEKALKSSRGMSLIAYVALGISLVVAVMNFIGPLQITRKPPR